MRLFHIIWQATRYNLQRNIIPVTFLAAHPGPVVHIILAWVFVYIQSIALFSTHLSLSIAWKVFRFPLSIPRCHYDLLRCKTFGVDAPVNITTTTFPYSLSLTPYRHRDTCQRTVTHKNLKNTKLRIMIHKVLINTTATP